MADLDVDVNVFFHTRPVKPGPGFIRWTVRIEPVHFTATVQIGDSIMIEAPLDKYVLYQPIFLDAQGNPGRVDGVPVWSVSDAALGQVGVGPDGMTAYLRSKGVVGAVQVYVDADVDLGAGVKNLRGIGDVTWNAGEVTQIVMQGSIVDPPPAPNTLVWTD